MSKISKDSAETIEDLGVALDISGQLDGYTVDFVSIRSAHSLAPLLKGLPGDRCPCPHWGYLFAGKITVNYADHDETYTAGDAFFMSPGHVPAADAGSEFVQFSPKEQLQQVTDQMRANAQRLEQPAEA